MKRKRPIERWNYRRVRRAADKGASITGYIFGIHEVTYNQDTGEVEYIAPEPAIVEAIAAQFLENGIYSMLRAAYKPVLDLETKREVDS